MTMAAVCSQPWSRASLLTWEPSSDSSAHRKGCNSRHWLPQRGLLTGEWRRAAELDQVLAEPPIGMELVEAVIDRAHRRTLDREITALAATL